MPLNPFKFIKRFIHKNPHHLNKNSGLNLSTPDLYSSNPFSSSASIKITLRESTHSIMKNSHVDTFANTFTDYRKNDFKDNAMDGQGWDMLMNCLSKHSQLQEAVMMIGQSLQQKSKNADKARQLFQAYAEKGQERFALDEQFRVLQEEFHLSHLNIKETQDWIEAADKIKLESWYRSLNKYKLQEVVAELATGIRDKDKNILEACQLLESYLQKGEFKEDLQQTLSNIGYSNAVNANNNKKSNIQHWILKSQLFMERKVKFTQSAPPSPTISRSVSRQSPEVSYSSYPKKLSL